MNFKNIPFTQEIISNLEKVTPTPFHIYDEAGIVDNVVAFKKAFQWNPGFRNYFAVKAAPNPSLLKLLAGYGFGADCSSMAELLLAEKVGLRGEQIMFTSNDTPAEEFRKAFELGAIINLDDISHIDFVEKACGALPELV
jgi:diaminopimelate decarboxylase